MRRQNAAIILTKREDCTLCEAFEVSPSGNAVEKTPDPLIRSYPGSSVETPNEMFDDGEFQFKLANFLSRPNAVGRHSPLLPPASPQYINVLLHGVLQPDIWRPTADVLRITKRIRNHVGRVLAAWGAVWCRSPLWLLTRVAIQMTVNRSLGHAASYKRFVLFLMCTLAGDESNTTLSSDLLHLMSSRILRRLSKLGSSAPDWLSEMALKTCACLRELLDARWEQLNARPSPFRNPSQAELARDTQLSLLDNREYIRNALASPDLRPVCTPFHPTHRRRGTIEDFLSSNGTFLARHTMSTLTLLSMTSSDRSRRASMTGLHASRMWTRHVHSSRF